MGATTGADFDVKIHLHQSASKEMLVNVGLDYITCLRIRQEIECQVARLSQSRESPETSRAKAW
ncbi:MAG: hypothetical protein QME21_01650, partial [Anaerolineales bacterium]|nr:hypothetical protein [Anaerolineales bacterium]